MVWCRDMHGCVFLFFFKWDVARNVHLCFRTYIDAHRNRHLSKAMLFVFDIESS